MRPKQSHADETGAGLTPATQRVLVFFDYGRDAGGTRRRHPPGTSDTRPAGDDFDGVGVCDVGDAVGIDGPAGRTGQQGVSGDSRTASVALGRDHVVARYLCGDLRLADRHRNRT